jgi:hypothetical protein
MEKQGVEVVNQPQHLFGCEDVDQFKGCGNGWTARFQFGERTGEGFLGGDRVVDGYCCASYVYELDGKGMPIFLNSS